MVHVIFSLLQLYFIFKYGNVIVNKNRWLARFAFAHCMSSCLSFWVYTLYNETLDAIVKKYFPKELSSEDCYSSGYDDGHNDGDTDGDGDDDRLKRFMGNVTTNAIYIWTSCVKNDSSIGNNMRCVVNTYIPLYRIKNRNNISRLRRESNVTMRNKFIRYSMCPPGSTHSPLSSTF